MQGWSKFYEFSFADLRSGADIINLRTKGGSGPQWQYLHGLLENAIYGGRVDNPFDLKVRPGARPSTTRIRKSRCLPQRPDVLTVARCCPRSSTPTWTSSSPLT
jgi:hypothetical protein